MDKRIRPYRNKKAAIKREKVIMIEAGASEVKEDVMFDAIVYAHEEIKKICDFIQTMVDEIGKPKHEYISADINHDHYDAVKAYAYDKVCEAIDTDDKTVRDANMAVVTDDVVAHFAEEIPELEAEIGEILYKLQKEIVRKWLIKDHRRVDGRGILEIRPLSSRVGILPRVHGSGLFSRGQTQVLTVATLGALRDEQMLDGIDECASKRYMHHYNFPSYSVGETKPSRGPGRREIGHGALAERALEPVIPSKEEFPYAIRLVSEVLSSNGSTSQGSVCGSTLALMDAGVPIKAPVAGISCGLVTDGDDYLTMVDIQGLEDFYGDMDFKVAGTHKGITSIQMDLKIDGLTPEIIKGAFERTRKGREYIIDEYILKAIPAPREEISKYAPKVIVMKIDTDKIAAVIGKGGEMIKKITAETGAKIDIEEDGTVYILAVNPESGKVAKGIIDAIVFEPVVGCCYTGTVTRIIQIGAFVEIAPGKEGLVHISKLDTKRTENVEDVVAIGDKVTVKYLGVDEKGRINLSRKDALLESEASN